MLCFACLIWHLRFVFGLVLCFLWVWYELYGCYIVGFLVCGDVFCVKSLCALSGLFDVLYVLGCYLRVALFSCWFWILLD